MGLGIAALELPLNVTLFGLENGYNSLKTLKNWLPPIRSPRKLFFRSQPLNFLKIEPWEWGKTVFGSPTHGTNLAYRILAIRIGGKVIENHLSDTVRPAQSVFIWGQGSSVPTDLVRLVDEFSRGSRRTSCLTASRLGQMKVGLRVLFD